MVTRRPQYFPGTCQDIFNNFSCKTGADEKQEYYSCKIFHRRVKTLQDHICLGHIVR